jgi:hypothetical protein
MNWKQRLFKPKWQHNSANIRLESVTTEQHPELISSLVEIAATDDDIRIRCAAIKRLHQLENILKLHSNETHQEVKTLLEDRIRQLAASTNESRPALALRLQVVGTTSDRDLIEHLAAHAPEAELRRAALAKVERQGVLGNCCVQDNDAENRNFAAGRITQQTTLKRVMDELRKRDKTLYVKLQARLHKESLELADPKAVQTEALKICSALEKLALDTDERDMAKTEVLHRAWHQIANHATTAMANRYQRICDRLAAPPIVIPSVITTPAPVVDAITDARSETKADDIEPANDPHTVIAVASHAHEALALTASAICQYAIDNAVQPRQTSVNKFKNELDRIWKQCTPPHPQDLICWNEANTALQALEAALDQQQQQFEKELSQAQELLTRLETELEQGELHKALETRAKLQQSGKGRGKDKDWQQINSKMAGMQARLRELRDWQHWSNNKIRNRLIAEMEVLPAADLHPDALLDRVKSLQMEWKTLEQSEQIPGDKHFAAAPRLWRKFSDAGRAAFETAKPYLDKRSEIQSRHAQTLTTFCAELEQLALAEPADLTALGKALIEGRKKLHDLDDVPVRQRQKIARQLKATLDKANAVIQAHYQAVEREKMKLIRSASQLIHMPERSEAISQAKSLQSSWKSAGRLWRSKEQELWDQFRAHLDPLFSELKEQQASIQAADDERLAGQKVLCAELKDILKSEEDLSALHGKVQGLRDSWKDIQHPDRKLLQLFQDMVTEYEKQLKRAQQQREETNRERCWLKSALLHELTVSGRTAKGSISKRTEARVKMAWPEDSSDDALENSLDQTYAEILAGNVTGLAANELEELQAQARTLCIGLEFVAGLPSPPEDRSLRMQYQVDRLAESMAGTGVRQAATDEARDAERLWLGMYALPESDFETFGTRVKQALSAINVSV